MASERKVRLTVKVIAVDITEEVADALETALRAAIDTVPTADYTSNKIADNPKSE